MKKILITTMLIGAALTISADNYGYLTIEKSDGSKVSLTAVGTTITFANGCLKAVSGSEATTIALTELSKMRFTASNESGETAISNLDAQETISLDDADAVYDLQGRLIDPSQTKKGIYIMRKGSITKKIQIK